MRVQNTPPNSIRAHMRHCRRQTIDQKAYRARLKAALHCRAWLSGFRSRSSSGRSREHLGDLRISPVSNMRKQANAAANLIILVHRDSATNYGTS